MTEPPTAELSTAEPSGNLLWPGAERAGEQLSDVALLAAMVAVEQAWLAVGPAGIECELAGLLGPADLAVIAGTAEAAGSPVLGLLTRLRERVPSPVAKWLHRGLTSQDVLDTALMFGARDVAAELDRQLSAQAGLLAALAATHRDSPAIARTLTQPATPSTFGLVAAGWLAAVLDARAAVRALTFPVQVGGAAGTLAAIVELGGGLPHADALAARLSLAPALPWHTRRVPITRIGDAAVTATDAWGHLAGDILTLGRPELGEVRETSAGRSSTMPQKQNPVLATLVRRAALTTPQLAATLHLTAAEPADQRAAGAWQAEWDTLRILLRRTLVAAAQTTDLLAGLEVDTVRMSQRLTSLWSDVTAEQRAMAELAGHRTAGDYLGAAGEIVDAVLARMTTEDREATR